jgi:hypothetical protein
MNLFEFLEENFAESFAIIYYFNLKFLDDKCPIFFLFEPLNL